MAAHIARVDGAITVEIPEELLKKANLSVGDPVEWTLTSAGTLALRAPDSVQATHSQDSYERWKAEEIRAGFTEIEAGESVSNEKVVEWLRNWGSTHELPPPR
jgi:antitoxin component of MazEF toxin-antitoxin module